MARPLAPVQPPPLRQSSTNLVRAARLPMDETEGRWVAGLSFQPLANVMPWIDDACLSRAYDVPALGAPVGVQATVTSTSSGSVSGTPHYVVTALGGNGESVTSQSAAVTASGTTNTVQVSWTGESRATGYRVYVDRAGGTSYHLIGEVSGSDTVTFADTGQAVSAAAPTADSSGGPGSFPNPPMVEYVPPIARVWDRCSVMSGPAHLYSDRVKAIMEATWPTALEYEFWTGAQAQRSGWPNKYLASSDAVDLTPGTVPSVVRAIEILEEAIAGGGSNGGTQGMIHMRPEALSVAFPMAGLRRDGNLLLTQNDTLIVPGNGYPNWGPASTVDNPSIPSPGQVWLYATGLVDVRVDDVKLFPDADALSEDEWKIEAMSALRTDNEIVLRAERFFSAVWDGQLHVACRANLDT